MSSIASSVNTARPSRPNLDSKPSKVTLFVFITLLMGGLIFTAFSLMHDVSETGAKTLPICRSFY